MDTKTQAIEDALKALEAAKSDNFIPTSGSTQKAKRDPRLKQPAIDPNKIPPTNNKSTSSNSGQQKQQKRSPQIGDQGNKAIQDAEEAERQANAYKDAAEEAAENAETKEEAENADDLADAAKDLKADISKSGQISKKELERLDRIKKALNDLDNQAKALEETEKAVFTSQQLAADKQRRREYEQNVNQRFIDSIYLFMRNEVASFRSPTWKRFSKRYVSSNPLLQKGKGRTQNEKIPKINFYFDRSASWDDEKIAVGQKVISSLRVFERKGLLKINIYYFGDTIETDPNSPKLNGGTSATQLILDHIIATKADNVVIMTDDDMDNQGQFTSNVTVDGGVWFGFVGGVCKEIIKHLHGKKLTQGFELNK